MRDDDEYRELEKSNGGIEKRFSVTIPTRTVTFRKHRQMKHEELLCLTCNLGGGLRVPPRVSPERLVTNGFLT